MEPKKNPRYDVHRHRSAIFSFSLCVSLLVVITSFEWIRVPGGQSSDRNADNGNYEEPLFYVAPFREEKKESSSGPSKKKKVTNPTFVAAKEDAPENDQPEWSEPSPEESTVFDVTTGDFPEPEVPDTVEFRVVEHMPEPVGGWSEFFRTLQKNLKYPGPARRAEVSGKVFVEFTVTENGSLKSLKVLKGIGHGCDEEALRVIALTKWKAGRQRGRPVKVRLVQPISFSLY